jgi:hypothetical protein
MGAEGKRNQMSDDAFEVIRPNSEAQEKALASPADILIYGGAAGGGKSWYLRACAIPMLSDDHFNGIIFRRTTKQLRGGESGSMWGDAKKMFRPFGPRINEQDMMLRFEGGASLRFWHIEHESNLEDHQGPEYAYVGFDEITQFPENFFWFLFGRLRSLGGWEPFIRGTCNPDPDSWIRGFLDWWIGEDGYPIAERDGVIRWFFRDEDDGEIIWLEEDQFDEHGNPPLDSDGDPPTSVTFIAAKLEDNATLMETDPGYRRKLKAMSKVERERFLGGNWNVANKTGTFEHHVIDPKGQHIDDIPKGLKWVRYWDLADTEPTKEMAQSRKKKICETAGAKVALHLEPNPLGGPPIQTLYIGHVAAKKLSGGRKQKWMRATALREDDPNEVMQAIEQEPGATGKESIATYKAVVFAGYVFAADRPSGNKAYRASRWAGLAEIPGRVVLVRKGDEPEDWFAPFLAQLNKYPNMLLDKVDAVSGGYAVLTKPRKRKKTKGIFS